MSKPAEEDHGQAVVLVAKSAITAAPLREMERLTAEVARRPGIVEAAFAFTEQGVPTLREVVDRLAGEGRDILLLPLIVPMEPSFRIWLRHSLNRWRKTASAAWPAIKIADAPIEAPAIGTLIDDMIQSARCAPPLPAQIEGADNAIVPAQERRVLVCHGPPCNNGDATMIWAHLRNEQDRLDLRNVAGGTMTAKSTCLGPCALAPVLQVFPEGVYYGGVDEAGIDRIIHDHLLNDVVVDELAYRPNGKKQSLRPKKIIGETR